ncbi:EamA family transporter [Nocardioides convexus]|uniref:EamA family transporter n=1 Tax=Nocardioides convexus TaxID=2712224 RepID=UPI0024184FC7|nr:EamA family transporter [Nocardioides convexus]
MFPTAIAFTTYAFALRHMSASALGVTTYLVPPITIVLGLVLLDEVPPPVAYVGGVLALLGVGIARRAPSKPAATVAPAAPAQEPAV